MINGFLSKVTEGILTVSKDGTVYNNKTKRFIGAISSNGYVKISMYSHKEDGASDGDWKKFRKAVKGWTLTLGIFFGVSIVLDGLIPSKETVYAIAASEVGEEIVKSPVVNKGFKAVEAWMDKQIAGAKAATPPKAPQEAAQGS